MSKKIYDDVFRTMLEKSPFLMVPLINEVFGKDYPKDIQIIQLRNEHHNKDGEIVTDSSLQIGRNIYHIECQSTDDKTMAIRMIQYDLAIALEYAERNGREYVVRFPQSCVIYIRDFDLPSELTVKVVYPDGTEHRYSVPVVKADDYTKEEISQKDLLMLLPYYILRYEKYAADPQNDMDLEVRKKIFADYHEIQKIMEMSFVEEHSGLYVDMYEWITAVADYVFRKHKDIAKGIGDIMGGKVLELKSEQLIAEGKKEGEKEGVDLSFLLINKLIADGRNDEIALASSDPDYREKLFKEYGF